MHRHSTELWKLLGNFVRPRAKRRQATSYRRPCLEAFEDRLVPSGVTNTSSGIVSGLVFVDANGNGQHDAGEVGLPGVQITLSGASTSNQQVNLTTTTDTNGDYTFFQVQPGTYQLSRGSLTTVLANPAFSGTLGGTPVGQTITTITVAPGQVGLNYNFTVRGLAPQGISLAKFVTSFTGSLFTTQAAGTGTAFGDGLNQYASTTPTGSATLGGSVYNSSTFTSQSNIAAAGIAGVEVTLSGVDSTGNAILLTTTTATNGSYQFSNLNPGNYALSVPQQPAGFRAGPASIGTLAGISTHNNQVTGIQVASGSKDTTYNFSEIPLGSATAGPGPALIGVLADDTGASATDGVTSDPSIQGSVTSGNTLTSFVASIDGKSPTSILGQVTSNGNFLLNQALVNQIAGGTLADGSHTLELTATDSKGNTSTVTVSFTLLTSTPTQPTFDFATSQSLGDLATNIHVAKLDSSGTYTITGIATAGNTVEIQGLGAALTTTADSLGNFTFTGVPLAASINGLTVLSVDKAGNFNSLSALFLIDTTPTTTGIANQTATIGQTSAALNLSSFFSTPITTNTTVQFNTSVGPIDIQLDDSIAPNTVANFLSYANSPTANGSYTNSIFDRLIAGFVLQGGSFNFNATTSSLTSITAGLPINSEHTLPGAKSNVTGSIAMALPNNSDGTTNVNGATDAYYINLVNNPNLDTQGFTVFGQVANGQSMRAVNALAALPTQNETSFNAALANLPLQNYTGSSFPSGLTTSNLAFISSVSTVQASASEAYTFAASGYDSSIATVAITNNQLTITPVKAGITNVTVTATDKSGLSVQTTFQVTVS